MITNALVLVELKGDQTKSVDITAAPANAAGMKGCNVICDATLQSQAKYSTIDLTDTTRRESTSSCPGSCRTKAQSLYQECVVTAYGKGYDAKGCLVFWSILTNV